MGSPLAANVVVYNRFRVIELLGGGNGGAFTYRALDTSTGAQVTLKQLDVGSVDSWRRVDLFAREGRVLAAIAHPRVPRLVAHFADTVLGVEHYFLASAFVEGRTYAEHMADGARATESECVALATDILDVLAYLQRQQPPIFHRDIKPSNIVRGPDGAAHLIDFGAVRDVARNEATAHTVVGTFGYMAPEQLAGHATMASDPYGLPSRRTS